MNYTSASLLDSSFWVYPGLETFFVFFEVTYLVMYAVAIPKDNPAAKYVISSLHTISPNQPHNLERVDLLFGWCISSMLFDPFRLSFLFSDSHPNQLLDTSVFKPVVVIAAMDFFPPKGQIGDVLQLIS